MPAVWLPGRVHTEFLVTAAETAGAFSMFRDHPPAGWSIPPHLHASESETIHVLDGRFRFEIEGEGADYGPGDTLHVPAGTVHAGAVTGARGGRRLIVFSPGGMERLFERIGNANAEDPVDLAEALALARRHGWRFAGDPG